MKDLMKIHNLVKFHLHSICGCEVIYFQSFWYQQNWRFWAAFGWFLGYYDPQIKFDFHKIFTGDAAQGKVSHILRVLKYY